LLGPGIIGHKSWIFPTGVTDAEARITDTTVEIFYKGSRIASHIRWDRERKCPRPRHPGYYRTAAGAIPL
jgi:hypothetical protein